MADDPLNDASAEERANNGEEPLTEEELFPMGALDGEGITPQTVVPRRAEPTVTVSIGKAEVPMRDGGLLNPNKLGRVLVTYRWKKNEDVGLHNDGEHPEKITDWVIRQHLEALYVQHANDVPALLVREFDNLRRDDPEAAGALLDELQRLMAGDLAEAA